ncbi:hypothetical protein BC777_0278 [Yoonia maricola]|uniref:Exopolysaccharide production repressor protein n=1 Tax=Yoonia maricola TaxID=420999 RepID=A0A2M8WKL7_9RHOB|nr:hypothetical protein [Yoonia maricola]PJI91450.1 hypothetical protein BC777_0278 [Yoonia maricola]
MRLQIFACFMGVVAAAMAVFSYLAGADAGTIILRVVVVLLVLQVAYFLLLVAMSMLSPAKPKPVESDQNAPVDALAKTQKQ